MWVGNNLHHPQNVGSGHKDALRRVAHNSTFKMGKRILLDQPTPPGDLHEMPGVGLPLVDRRSGAAPAKHSSAELVTVGGGDLG